MRSLLSAETEFIAGGRSFAPMPAQSSPWSGSNLHHWWPREVGDEPAAAFAANPPNTAVEAGQLSQQVSYPAQSSIAEAAVASPFASPDRKSVV